MTIKTILCVLDGGEASASALQTAILAGQSLGCYVEVLHVQLDPQNAVPLAADGMTATMVEEIVESVQSEGNRRRAVVEGLYRSQVVDAGLPTVPAGVPGQNGFVVAERVVRGREHEVVASYGMLFDLLVATRRHGRGEPAAPPTLEAAIMDSGRPVIVAPAAPPEVLGKHVAIAWRATVAGVHALAGAVDLLAQAESVTVITVDEYGTERAEPQDVVNYLTYHGAQARARHVEQTPRREAGQMILDEAQAAGADLLVMGAYAHSRLRQLILGGVTRKVLRASNIPLLLAH